MRIEDAIKLRSIESIIMAHIDKAQDDVFTPKELSDVLDINFASICSRLKRMLAKGKISCYAFSTYVRVYGTEKAIKKLKAMINEHN